MPYRHKIVRYIFFPCFSPPSLFHYLFFFIHGPLFFFCFLFFFPFSLPLSLSILAHCMYHAWVYSSAPFSFLCAWTFFFLRFRCFFVAVVPLPNGPRSGVLPRTGRHAPVREREDKHERCPPPLCRWTHHLKQILLIIYRRS